MTPSWLRRVPGVDDLRNAEIELLQILLSEFELFREGTGLHLKVSLDPSAPTIRRRDSKDGLQDAMPGYPARVEEIQAELERVLLEGGSPATRYRYDDFVFRYASGGTLPILRRGSEEYYCLFYRDIEPVGWNIANGSCDSVEELHNLDMTIEREFREELLLINPTERRDYLLSWASRSGLHLPEFDRARRLWSDRLNIDIRGYERPEVFIEWKSGNDAVSVVSGLDSSLAASGCFLNINAKDYGIEVDRIAVLDWPDGSSPLDGEINNGKVLGRPVGLFERSALTEKMERGASDFKPDLLYYDLAPYSPSGLERLIGGDFLQRLVKTGLRARADRDRWMSATVARFDLCPVTRQIIRRHAESSTGPSQGPKAFISYSHHDGVVARRVCELLNARGVRCWLDAIDLKPGDAIAGSIYRAIRTHDRLLLCCSRDSLSSSWVQEEILMARDEEARRGVSILVPLDLDGYIDEWDHEYAPSLRDRLSVRLSDLDLEAEEFHTELDQIVRLLGDAGPRAS